MTRWGKVRVQADSRPAMPPDPGQGRWGKTRFQALLTLE